MQKIKTAAWALALCSTLATGQSVANTTSNWLFSGSIAGGASIFNSIGEEDSGIDASPIGGDDFISKQGRDIVREKADGMLELYSGYRLTPRASLGLAVDYFPVTYKADTNWLIDEERHHKEANKLADNDYQLQLKNRTAVLVRFTHSLPFASQSKWSIGMEAGLSQQNVEVNQSASWYSGNQEKPLPTQHYKKFRTGAEIGAFTQYNANGGVTFMAGYTLNAVGSVDFKSQVPIDGAVISHFETSQRIYVNNFLVQLGYVF